MQRLGVHVFVEGAKAHEVAQALVLRFAREARQRPFEDLSQVSTRCGQVGQRQIPARVVRHVRGVVQRVSTRENRRRQRLALLVAKAPMFLEPADMADFPERRVDDSQLRPEQALAIDDRGDAREVIPACDEI